MGINRFAASADANQSAIVHALRHAGATVAIIKQPVDLAVGYNGRTYLFEVKAPNGRVMPHQEDFISTWAGDIAAIVRSPQEALALIGCESRGVEIGPKIFSSPWLDGTGSD